MEKTIKLHVNEYHQSDIRQIVKDPYRSIFEKIAKAIVKSLKKRSKERLVEIRTIAEITFVPDAFSEYIIVENKKLCFNHCRLKIILCLKKLKQSELLMGCSWTKCRLILKALFEMLTSVMLHGKNTV